MIKIYLFIIILTERRTFFRIRQTLKADALIYKYSKAFIFLILFAYSHLVFALNDIKFSEFKKVPNGQARWFSFSNLDSNQPDINFGLYIQLDPEWHTYWLNPGDSGAALDLYSIDPTVSSDHQGRIEIELSYTNPERIEVGPLTTYGYSNEVYFYFKIVGTENKILKADFLVCKEECLPASVELNNLSELIALSSGPDAGAETPAKRVKRQDKLENSLQHLPQVLKNESKLALSANYQESLNGVSWNITARQNIKILDIFWYPETVTDLKKPKLLKESSLSFKFFTPLSFLGPQVSKKALIIYELINSNIKPSADSNIKLTTQNKILSQVVVFKKQAPALFVFMLMAIFGGLILNLMPCVFPIVSIKAFSILKTSGQELLQIRKENIYYSIGVVFSFVSMGLLLSALRSSGQYLGWGFQLQNPYFVLGLAVVFFILSLSFFEIWNWNWVPKFATHYYSGNGFWPSFLTGFLAVIVASPCTAPFMGAAIGFAISQSTQVIILIFFGLGFGMSLPFLLIALFPKISFYLPRPGLWMVYFKKIMGLMLMLTVVWLFWITFQLLGTDKNKNIGNWNNLEIKNWDLMINETQPRFVNFTADWCVTCKVNEKLVFQNEDVIQFINENKIAMYKVDWTKRQDDIGLKLSEFGRAGVPLYLFIPEGSSTPIILNELLTPQGFITKLKE